MLNSILSWLHLLGDRRAVHEQRRAFAELDEESRYVTAMKAGLSVHELEKVVVNSARTERLLNGTLAALGLTPADVERRRAGTFRNLSVRCAQCDRAVTCGRELLSGTVPENLDLYCLNSSTLRRLSYY